MRAIILGGGISGLSLAWYLSKNPEMEVTLLEKEGRVGGWMESTLESGYTFELGPRLFKTSRYPDLLKLIQEMGLSDKLLPCSSAIESRYVWAKGALRRIPLRVTDCFFSTYMWPILAAFALERWKPKGHLEDESVYDFVARRFTPHIAEYFFDPLVVGIFGGDIRKLSIRSCFGILKEWEEKYGSITKGFFAERAKRKKAPFLHLPAHSFFTIEGGSETLIDALKERLKDKIVLKQEAQEVRFTQSSVSVKTRDRSWEGDILFSALPSHAIGRLLEPVDRRCSDILLNIYSQSLASVLLGYKEEVLPVSGAGYLVPTCEKQDLMGVMFESNVFPQLKQHPKETRLCAILACMDEPDATLIQKALQGLHKHLKIEKAFDFARVVRSKNAIPQYHVGHSAQIDALEKRVKEKLPRLRLLGNYLHGVSVNDCVRLAHLMTNG